jgi:hypothetical protein
MRKIFNYGDWEYTKDTVNRNVAISRYLGKDTDVTVPARINGVNIFYLDPFVFSGSPVNVNIKRVVLSEGILEIRAMALSLSSIQEVVLPSTIRNIDGAMFSESIQRVTVNSKNRSFFDIDGVLFSKNMGNTYLVYFPAGRTDSTYKIPDGTTHINWLAFNASKNLEHVIMPNSVVSLDDFSFINCPKLHSVRLSQNIVELKINTFYDCAVLSDIRTSRKIKVISPNAFDRCPQFKGINIQTRMSEQER